MFGNREHGEEGEGEKVIAIRGLNEELYKQLLSTAKERGKNVSELANEALSRYLSNDTDATIIAEGAEYLEIGKELLSSAGKPIILRAINRLKITNDVDADQIGSIRRIESCSIVQYPRALSIQVLERCRNCQRLVPLGEGETDPDQSSNPIPSLFERFFERRYVTSIDQLTLNQEQLAQFEEPVTFRKIDHLRLEEDVTKQDVMKHIYRFEKIDQLDVPGSLYPWILTYCHKCDSVIPY